MALVDPRSITAQWTCCGSLFESNLFHYLVSGFRPLFISKYMLINLLFTCFNRKNRPTTLCKVARDYVETLQDYKRKIRKVTESLHKMCGK